MFARALGAAAGSFAAALGTFATWRARGLVGERTGLPDPVVAVGEDMLAYGLAAVATRPAPESAPEDSDPSEGPRRPQLPRNLDIGLLAGLAGTGAPPTRRCTGSTGPRGDPLRSRSAAGDIPPEVSGPVFGLLVWGAGLAELPALGVAEPPWNRSLRSLASEALFHVVYGLGAGAAVRALRGSRSR